MKIGIVGYGFVGKALKSSLKSDVDSFIVDPLLKTTIDDLKIFGPKIIFLCLPTPMNNDGSQDANILREVLDKIISNKISGLVVIKSTVLPNLIDDYCDKLKFVFNPEFLRERSAKEDFFVLNSDFHIFGGEKEHTSLIEDFYNSYTLCNLKNIIHTDLVTASLVKYSINTFLASKVLFFNELNNIFKSSNAGSSWENFIDILKLDERVGSSHMEVPGPDGRFGFGGACFPKDINAFYEYSKVINSEFKLIKEVISINNNLRGCYNSQTDREVQQNISFHKKGDKKKK